MAKPRSAAAYAAARVTLSAICSQFDQLLSLPKDAGVDLDARTARGPITARDVASACDTLYLNLEQMRCDECDGFLPCRCMTDRQEVR